MLKIKDIKSIRQDKISAKKTLTFLPAIGQYSTCFHPKFDQIACMRVHTSQYSTIEVNKEEFFLSAAWLEESIKLKEEGVKKEITKILDYVRIYKIKKVVVDVKNYPFRENENIQRWINYEYIPMIIEKGVERYAIVVKEMVISKFEQMEEIIDDNDVMQIKYFTDLNAAMGWLQP